MEVPSANRTCMFGQSFPISENILMLSRGTVVAPVAHMYLHTFMYVWTLQN